MAAVMAAHAQRGLPAFSIYGHDVQDMTDTSIYDDIFEVFNQRLEELRSLYE